MSKAITLLFIHYIESRYQGFGVFRSWLESYRKTYPRIKMKVIKNKKKSAS